MVTTVHRFTQDSPSVDKVSSHDAPVHTGQRFRDKVSSHGVLVHTGQPFSGESQFPWCTCSHRTALQGIKSVPTVYRFTQDNASVDKVGFHDAPVHTGQPFSGSSLFRRCTGSHRTALQGIKSVPTMYWCTQDSPSVDKVGSHSPPVHTGQYFRG